MDSFIRAKTVTTRGFSITKSKSNNNNLVLYLKYYVRLGSLLIEEYSINQHIELKKLKNILRVLPVVREINFTPTSNKEWLKNGKDLGAYWRITRTKHISEEESFTKRENLKLIKRKCCTILKFCIKTMVPTKRILKRFGQQRF